MRDKNRKKIIKKQKQEIIQKIVPVKETRRNFINEIFTFFYTIFNNKKVLIILLFLAILFSSGAALKIPFFYNILINFYKSVKMPFDSVFIFKTYKIMVPDYFFFNFLLLFIFSFIILYLFFKKSGIIKSLNLNPYYTTFISLIIFLHLIVVGYFLSNKNYNLQAIIFLIEILMLFFFFVYIDKKEKGRIFYADVLKKSELNKLILFSFFTLLVYSFDQYSWKYSYIGDEYSFFDFAKAILTGARPVKIFSEAGVYDFNPELSSLYQAIIMFFSPDKFLGWKISSALIVVFSIIPFYVWNKMVFNKTAAIIATVAFAFSHTMLAFGHIGYNNIQAIFPFIAALCCFEIALRKNSSFWSFMTALVTGLGCYNYYFSRLLIIFLPFYWFVHPMRKNYSKRNIAIVTIVLFAIIMFIILNPHWIDPVMKRSVIQGSEVSNPTERPIYMVLNFIYTLFIFFYKNRDSHYVVGGMMDMISAIGVIIGIAWALLVIIKDWRAKFLIFCYLIMGIVVGALSQYSYVANTRVQFMIPLFATFAGIGLSRAISLCSYFKNGFCIYKKAIAIIVIFMVLLNIHRFYIVMPKKFQFTMQAYIVKAMTTMTDNKKCVVISDRLANLYDLANCYRYQNRFEVVSSSLFDLMLNQDSFKGKVLIIPFDSMGLKYEIMNFTKDGKTVVDFTGTRNLIYIYDFTDESYYNAFKELWLTGKTNYVVEHKAKVKETKNVETEKRKDEENRKKFEGRKDISIPTIATGFLKCEEKKIIDKKPISNVILNKLKLNLKLKLPSDITITPDSKYMYIADSYADSFYILKKKKEFSYNVIKKVNIKNEKEGLLNLFTKVDETKKPVYIYLKFNLANNNLYVYDSDFGLIKVYGSNGDFIKNLADGIFLMEGRSIELSPDGNIIGITIPVKNAIFLFNADGNLINVFSTTYGNLCGQIAQPCFVSFDSLKNLYVVDAANYRVEVFNKGMRYLNHYIIGNSSTILGPQILIFEKAKTPFFIVSQPWDKQLLVFSLDGKKMRTLELKGFGFENPGSMAKDDAGNIYILDNKNKFVCQIKLPDNLFE